MAGADGGAVMNWEIGIDIYTLIGIKWITNKNLLYKKINKIKLKNSKKKKKDRRFKSQSGLWPGSSPNLSSTVLLGQHVLALALLLTFSVAGGIWIGLVYHVKQ